MAIITKLVLVFFLFLFLFKSAHQSHSSARLPQSNVIEFHRCPDRCWAHAKLLKLIVENWTKLTGERSCRCFQHFNTDTCMGRFNLRYDFPRPKTGNPECISCTTSNGIQASLCSDLIIRAGISRPHVFAKRTIQQRRTNLISDYSTHSKPKSRWKKKSNAVEINDDLGNNAITRACVTVESHKIEYTTTTTRPNEYQKKRMMHRMR